MKNAVLTILFMGMILALAASLVWDDSVPIRQGVNIEWFRTGTQTADGCAIYVWSDTKLGERDLWAQKVDAQGNLVWGDPVLIDGKPDRQEDPVITMTSNGDFIIAWIDFSFDPDGDVYAQKINTDGQLLWPEGGKPVCTTPGMQIGLNLEADLEGGAFIVWSDSRNPSKDLYGQRLSASGDPLWALNGIPIANGEGIEEQNTMLPDGQGGMMIAYTHKYVDNEDIFMKRFNADGSMAWAETLVLADAPGNQSKVRMAALQDGEFVLTWEDQRNTDPDIYAMKVNLAGQKLWQDPFVVFGDSGNPSFAPQHNPRIQSTSDNCVVIVWEDKRLDSQHPDLFAQKISADGSLLWNPDGLVVSVADYAQLGVRMAADSNGGCYIVWDDHRNGNTPNDDIYAQHLSATGEELWTPGGRPVCTAPYQQEGGLIKVAGSNVFISWMDIRNGSVGLYYQAFDSAGNELLEENGKMLFWGLSGDTPLNDYLMLPRDNDVAIVWQDTRFANLGYQIFFQYLDFDGNTALETNGRPVTLATGGKQSKPAAAINPEGQILVLWVEHRDEHPNIYMQLLGSNGERLMGDYGTKLTQMMPIEQKGPRVSWHDGSFYVGWSNYDEVGSSYRFHVYGQRIQAGQKMWGEDGIMVGTLTGDELNNQCTLLDIQKDYYSWERFSPSDYTQSVYTLRMKPDANPADGWPVQGLRLSNHQDWDTMQRFPVSSLTDDGIFVMWQDKRGGMIYENYFGQHVSNSGETLWDPAGVALADYGREQSAAVIADKDGFRNEIIFAWCENINGMDDIIAHKYSLTGTPLWGDLGYFVVQKDSTQSSPSVGRFENSGMALAWSDYYGIESDIYYKYINSDGSLHGPEAGYVLCDAGKKQYDPKLVTIGNNAIALWADGRSSGKTEILGLYAQRLTNETVSVDDPALPPALSFQLLQNHPNPFNPSTRISFNVDSPGKKLSLVIHNLRGQKVKTLADGYFEKGTHSLIWDGLDENGRPVASGIYTYRLCDGTTTQTKRMVLMK